ncbi:MAG: DUF6339 family protein [Armatimonadota bacterium]|jgi:Family of unknown function (DUF6339)
MSNKTVKRLPTWQSWTPTRLASALNSGTKIDYEDYPTSVKISVDFEKEIGSNVDPSVEAALAIAIHEAIAPVKSQSPEIVKDNGFWMWFGLEICREQMIDRWCGGRNEDGNIRNERRASYFLSGDSLVKQSRCGVRRLWVAAEISKRCDGDYRHTQALLEIRDVFTGIVERMAGLDAELAVELMLHLKKLTTEDLRREVLRNTSVVLSTVAVETLDRKQKADLVELVVQDVTAKVPGS